MPSIDQIKKSAIDSDWQQMALNGGPHCFHICEDGKFCGMARVWDGHNDAHDFVSLYDLINDINDKAVAEALINVINSAINDMV